LNHSRRGCVAQVDLRFNYYARALPDGRNLPVTDLEASRRNMLAGIAAAGIAVPVLAACGDSGSTDATGTTRSSSSTSSSSASSPGGSIKTSEIPVGGGKIFTDEKIVVTQPTAGEFKAFSAVCTHQGCVVAKIASGTIDCTCHGSEFSIADGSVERGPATQALAEKTVTVSGDTLSVS
jgi:Rieske Fe-S protein